ncbi:MAG: bile acid:sodium symporter family protein [Halobacteria archaeon]
MGFVEYLKKASQIGSKYFVVWVLLFSALAVTTSIPFGELKPYISPLLGLVMLGMGLTLRKQDVTRLAKRPRDIGIGVLAQWIIMPVAAYVIVLAFSLPEEVALGLILVGAAPGGTASNVMTYLGKGDVALSVSITTVTTVAAPLVMPLWVVYLAGKRIDVAFGDLFWSITMIVLLPVIAGFILRLALDRYSPSAADVGVEVFPLISVVAIALIVAAVVSLNQNNLLTATPVVILAVVAHNAIGLSSGYITGKAAGMDNDRVRACTFEVGLQNSGLAVALATGFFDPLAALAPALFSVWHNITGPAVASYFARKETQ